MKHLLYLLLAAVSAVSCHGRPPADSVAYSSAAYHATLAKLTQRRAVLAARYRRARTATARAACLDQARTLWLTSLDSTIFPAWEGTPWDFYGATWEPRQGSIACGYFVTTTLHHSGLRLPRTLLAKQTATTIIKNLTSESHITRYRGITQAEFISQVRRLGPGLYVLGLDYHVAFLRIREGGAVQLVHSTVLWPRTVVREAADSSPALDSQARIVGKISADDHLVRAWLLGETLPPKNCTVKS